jgi:phenol 2-monooxygenase
MATKRPQFSYINGYQEVAVPSTAAANGHDGEKELAEADVYVAPPSVDLVTSPQHNSLGINVINSWPTIYDGTNSPHGLPSWWKPQDKVDVLICGGK